MDKNRVIDLVLFLDVCQLYLQTRKKTTRNLCTLWAIVTFVRDEDSVEFLRWCQAYRIKYLRQSEEIKKRNNKTTSSNNEKNICFEKRLLRMLQELFYCGCLPGDLKISSLGWMRRGKPARFIEARVMSECDGEQAARSVALEQAYVHEVYEQCAEKTAQSRQWPRIYKFLEELEPGALVCDIGCGNGKYLNFNNGIFKLGADRCKKLADIAREKENEVLICDNLALPFRDESFDAVLSIAVVHHFATTERRVNALKELARVLRIGGKLVISVWAMEQRHRKFESQDVLVPWPKAYCLNSTCNCETGLPCMNNVRRDEKTQKCILASKRIERQKNNKSKRYWIDPIFSPSPSTSSLSSPNETCYSFFRRALQKLAGGRRGGDTGSHNRRWFSESFHNNDCKNRCHHYEQDDGTDDVDDIPIELRRLEDENIIINKPNDSLSVKSKSLGDIIEIQKLDLVRSRSSIPGLCSTITSEINLDEETMSQATNSSYKPRLVKQKTHLIDDTCLEIHENTAIKEIINDLPKIPIDTTSTTKLSEKRANVQKQSSMNEELMSMERLLERERVRCKIMKQASLNEEIICKRGSALENFKDSLSSGIATRHFQMFKSGLTNRIKQSTTSMEKVASISIKNGFVKILQGWTSTDTNNYPDNEHFDDPTKIDIEKNSVQSSAITPTKKEPDIIERRLSKEDGSDSSKDSSLQSDTSVDSEDSFASVIYVPKKEAPQLIEITNSTMPCGYQLRTTSAPPSPRVKHPPDHHGPRIKLISISPLLKQFPATSKSLPPPSPPGLSPRTINSFNSRPFFGPNYQNNIINQFDKFTSKQIETTTSIPVKIDEKSKINDGLLEEDKQLKTIEFEQTENVQIVKSAPAEINLNPNHEKIADITENIIKKTNLDVFKGHNKKSMPIAANEREEVINNNDALTLISNNDIKDNSSTESVSDEDSRRSRLNQIKELLKQKPGFATRCTKPTFPLVRRASTANAGRLETVARTLPRLLSLELFNPETDDLDSDSSGVSSPESVGSVISVISDERFIVKKENLKKEEKPEKLKNNNEQSINDNSEETTSSTVEITSSSSSSQSFRLLEAAVNVATSLESAVETVIRVRTEPQEFNENPSKKDLLKSLSRNNNDDDNRWNEERKRHLIDFTEKLSENLINEIDQYCQKSCLEFNDSTIKVNNTPRTHKDLSVKAISNIKYNELVDNTIAWLRSSTGDNDFSENDNKLTEIEPLTEVTEITTNYGVESLCLSSSSEETIDFVMVSKNGEIEDRVTNTTNNSLINCNVEKCNNTAKNNNKSFTKLGDSLESSDIGDSIDTTVSLSDDSSNTKRLCSASTASLGSINVDYNISVKDKRKYRYGRRSISEEITTDNRRFNEIKSDNFSESSSQESLPSDHGGGAITYHQYYHVFREGELDQLINKYVENLHIISSYYDHANWCIVAEKVQVWTI
ncbi:hypothetical protein PV326_010848 [Microctonus aethiopoides]|nr:hypothetical protein PV326_010848 [Microctonus aethiopoides]